MSSYWKIPRIVCAAGLLGLFMFTCAQANAVWDVKRIGHLDYVSAESIKKFYQFSSVTRSGKFLVLENPRVRMSLEVGGNDCLMNRVKFVFSNRIISEGGKTFVSRTDLSKLIDPVLRPNYIKNAGNFRTVILDPGHGGSDPGATCPYGTEASYTLKVAQALKAMLVTAGFKIVMTRESNRFYSLQERVNIANAVKERAIFISIHFNSGGSAASGIETFTLSPPGVAHYGRGLIAQDALAHAGNEHDSANIALATAVHSSVLRSLVDPVTQKAPVDRGIKRARYNVISGVTHPAILLEGGFVTNPTESKLIETQAYQRALATGVFTAINTYLKAVTR